jgi:hypothetical protein
VNSYKVVIEDIYNLKFVFPDGEIQGNIMCLPGFLLEKSISGVDFSNRKSIVDFLRVIILMMIENITGLWYLRGMIWLY